jgi:thymidylate synthase (FAD)
MVENEESRRYISTTPEIFIPEFFRSKPEGSIKQGSGEKHKNSDLWKSVYESKMKATVILYEDMINDGVCPEQCRFVLPQGAIVNWIWTGNLVSFANFYNKRTDPTAQKEVQVVAELVGKEVERIFPVSWKALVEK